VVRSPSPSSLTWSSELCVTLHLFTVLFNSTYLSSSSNISGWAARAGIWRSCTYTASNWRTRDRPCHGLWTDWRWTKTASLLNLIPDFIHTISYFTKELDLR
jgi:hypothetical protein